VAHPIYLLIFVAYWVPAIVAFARHHHQRNSILVINLFLGWTFIGWIVALAMSVGQVKPASVV
jgi:hypothetical protein